MNEFPIPTYKVREHFPGSFSRLLFYAKYVYSRHLIKMPESDSFITTHPTHSYTLFFVYQEINSPTEMTAFL